MLARQAGQLSAAPFVLAIAHEMPKQRLTKSAMTPQMAPSRAALDRLLDPDNASVTLATLSRAARAIRRMPQMGWIACERRPGSRTFPGLGAHASNVKPVISAAPQSADYAGPDPVTARWLKLIARQEVA